MPRFVVPHSERDSGNPSHAASELHVTLCFSTLTAHLSGSAKPVYDLSDVTCPLFVTWNKSSAGVRRAGRYNLRGCIGTLTPRPLQTSLPEYALTAALRDPRFPAITQAEITLLKCTVSLLHGFEAASNWRDWQVGVHGLIISFRDPDTAEKRTGTFLPEIAEAEGWDTKTTIDSLISKAGYRGCPTPVLRDALQVTRYQSTAHSMTHSEYVAAVKGGADAPSSQQPAARLLHQDSPLVGAVPA